MPTEGLLKQLNDLEAHLNTSIITEKSVRKAQDKYLAEEIDKFQKLITTLQAQLKIKLDGEGKVSSAAAESPEEVAQLRDQIMALQEETKTLRVEINDLHERPAGANQEIPDDITQKLQQIERMSAQIEELREVVNKPKDKDDEYFTFATVDQVDGKIQAMLEALKLDNQVLWKETVKLAEERFSTGGV